MPNQPPLTPDALHQLFAVAMMEVLDAEKLQPGDRLAHVNDIQEVLNRLEKNILAIAQQEGNSFDPRELNRRGWTCGCEPGNYDKCEDCQTACNELANFLNRLGASK